MAQQTPTHNLAPSAAIAGDVLVYEYGVRLDKECTVAAVDQIHKARRLYNELVAAIRVVVTNMQADILARAGDDARAVQVRVDDLTAQFAAAKAANDESSMSNIAKTRREAWRELAGMLKEVRKDCREDHKTRFFSRIGKTTTTDTYQLRCKAVNEGLGWATANAILDNALNAFKKSFVLGKAPRFAAAAEKEQDTLTLQFTAAGGVSAQSLLDGEHGEFVLQPTQGCGRRKYGEFKFRLGSAKAETFATGTWQYHRPLPDGASVGVARLIRRRIGKDFRWCVQLALKLPEPVRIATERRKLMATVHFGWAADVEGRRVAGIADSADPGAARLLQLPPEIETGLAMAAELQGKRDTSRDKIVPKVKEIDLEPLPEEIQEYLRAIRRLPVQHVAISRLYRLCHMLRDAELTPGWLEAWRKQDRLIWQASTHIARRARNARRDFYRKTALDIAKNYEAVVIEPLDLAEAARKIDETTGERSDFGRKARAGRVVAAIYELESAIRWACTKTGTAVLELTASTATYCAICGGAITTNTEQHQLVRCNDCGAELDRKKNGAAVAWQLAEPGREGAVEDYHLTAADNRAARLQEKQLKLEKRVTARKANKLLETKVDQVEDDSCANL